MKNIPKGLDCNYVEELDRIFRFVAVSDSANTIDVKKVVLVYDTTELFEMEEEVIDLVREK